MNKITNRQVICDTLMEAAKTDRDIMVLCSDSRGSASLTPFAKASPEQFIEVGIPAAAVSVMMLVVRIFDAFNDPVIGSLADRTNSRWRRYRPWFLLGSAAMAIFIVLIFGASPDWSYPVRMVWMWGIYLLLTVASTCSNMPYGALNGCITPDTEDRAKVSGLRMMFANVSSMVTVIIAVPLIRVFARDGSATDAGGYFWAVLITCLLGLPTMIVCCWKTKEVVTPPPNQDSIPLKAQIQSLVKNKPVIILILGQLILGCVIYGRAAILAYYWQYNAGDAGYATTYGWISLAAAVLAALGYAANADQTPQVLNAVNWFITLIPAILSVLNGLFYLMYPISTEKHKEIMEELIRRRS